MSKKRDLRDFLQAGTRRLALVSGLIVFAVTSFLIGVVGYEGVSRNIGFLATQMTRELVRHASDEDDFRLRRSLMDLVEDFQSHEGSRLSFEVALDDREIMSTQAGGNRRFTWEFRPRLPTDRNARITLGVDSWSVMRSAVFGVVAGFGIALIFLLLVRKMILSFVGPASEDLDAIRNSKPPVHFRDFERFHAALEESRRMRSYEAIAQTTQALAHDVRKPFSMFKSIIQIVEGTEDPDEVRDVLHLTLPEVNQAMASVEGMIQDVMQMGADAPIRRENVSPESLVETALVNLFRVHPDADVLLKYSFAHRHMVHADPVRLERVFSNIFGNALQAMNERGTLWIQTVEREGFVEFTLGNSGSFIPEESLARIFDAFFTSGKRGGTGLGLAIAKKIVESHRGTIRCHSESNEKHPKGFVEFVFTLPLSENECALHSEALPHSSREFQAARTAARFTRVSQSVARSDRLETDLEKYICDEINSFTSDRSERITVLVIDEAAAYRNGLFALLEKSALISAHIQMIFAKNEVEAVAAVNEHHPILLIGEVDLGPHSKDGLEIVKVLRDEGFAGQVCIHSNRFLESDNRAAFAAGADSILPKPLSRAQFLRLLFDSLSKSRLARSSSSHSRKLNVAVLDDSIAMRTAWKMGLEGATCFRSFASTTAFFQLCDCDEFYLGSLDAIVTDFNFASKDPHDGASLARALRARGYGGLIFLASGEGELGSEIEALFDGDFGKRALEWPNFLVAVEEARRKVALRAAVPTS